MEKTKLKISHSLKPNNRSPNIYILTPDEIPLGKKYKYGPGKTFRTRFIQEKEVIQKLSFEYGAQELDTPARKVILNGEQSAQTMKFDSLGKGGFGSVFLAIRDNQMVACKVIKLRTTSNFISFLRERNAIGLNHKNLVRTISVQRGPKAAIVIMEKANRMSLQEKLDQDEFKSDRAKSQCIIELCTALEYLHGNNILHLDVKPLNMLIERDGSLKLADFGNSSMTNGLGKFYSLGTIRYTDPCIFEFSKASTKSDVYSIGITMWQMVFNQIPYNGIVNDGSLMYQIVKRNLRPVPQEKEINSSGLRVFQETYKCCWNRDPSLRPILNVIVSKMRVSMGCLGSDDKWSQEI